MLQRRLAIMALLADER